MTLCSANMDFTCLLISLSYPQLLNGRGLASYFYPLCHVQWLPLTQGSAIAEEGYETRTEVEKYKIAHNCCSPPLNFVTHFPIRGYPSKYLFYRE